MASGTDSPTATRPVDDLETQRLLLRPWSTGDIDGLLRLTGTPEVMRYLGSRTPRSREETERDHAAKLAHWRRHGFGARAAIVKDTGEWIGYVVLQFVPPGVIALDPDDVEIGWLLKPSAWRHGFATEAALALLDEAFTRITLNRLVARCQSENEASVRIMKKIGMHFEREAINPYGHAIHISSIDRPTLTH
jgi:RimJ/RimL family protein N-acetyltransferase